MYRSKWRKLLDIVVHISWATLILVGTTVISGWYLGSTQLIQIHASFAPMQYNTAFCFLLLGLSIFLTAVCHSRLAAIPALVTGIFGALTLSQYLHGISLGIDEFFMRGYITVRTSHPGRMSPNTAMCFLLSGFSALVLTETVFGQRAKWISGLVATVVAALGFMSLSGYLLRVVEAYDWGVPAGMALHTATGFLIAGAGLLSYATSQSEKNIAATRWLSLVAGIGVLAAGLSMWQALSHEAARRAEDHVAARRSGILSIIDAGITSRFEALGRMAKRLASPEGQNERRWREDAKNYLETIPGLQAVAWTSPSGHVLWSESQSHDAAVKGLGLTSESYRHAALTTAIETRSHATTPAIPLAHGGQGLLHIVPVDTGDVLAGFVLGVFRVDILFDALFTSVGCDFDTAILQESEHLHGTIPKPGKTSYPIQALDNGIRVQIEPNVAYAKFLRSNLPNHVLLGTALIAILVTTSIYLAQSTIRSLQIAAIANRELARSEDYLSTLVEALPIGVLTVDHAGIVQRINQSLVDMLGYSSEEIIGQKVETFLPVDMRDRNAAYAAEYRASPVARLMDENQERYATAKDGRRIPLEISLAPVRHAGGREVVASIVDTSGRKKLEAERENWRKLVHGIIDNASAVIYVKDAKGKYLLINSNYLKIFSLDESQVVGLNDDQIFPPEFAAKFREADQLVLDSGAPISLEEAAPLEDGVHQYITTKFPIRDEVGNVYAVAGISTDITELKAIEHALREREGELKDEVKRREQAEMELEQLNRDLEDRVARRTAELEESNRELDAFTFVASHDLQEPLRKQQMFTDVLSEELQGELSEDAERAMSAIRSAAERMRNLIRALLQLSRTRSRELALQPVALNDLVAEATDTLELVIQETGAQVASAELTEVLGDPVLLVQVFQNLISNGIRYQVAGTQPRIAIDVSCANSLVEVAVRDNGIGIDADALEDIFTPFKRLHARADYPGTGIGLSVCKRIVERHGGKIWAESEPGKGSVFRFTLRPNGENTANG